MASVSPRISVLWSDARTPRGTMTRSASAHGGYFSGRHHDYDYEQAGDDEESAMMGDEENGLEDEEDVLDDEEDGRTPLDRTIDKIGMGSYQWALLSLCGFGWMADNMWLQAVAIILPRVQHHYNVSDGYIGILSASMFAGMMIGAIGWGTCSDLMGRSTAFNATLFFTAIFGILASFTESFAALCTLLFFLGSSVGGSMPTDGTLLLEHMPNGKQHLVTALSVFFSAGSVFAAIGALYVLPGNTCRADDVCDVNTQNTGWKKLLFALGVLTFLLFMARMVFFTLHESPRYLVHAGRPQDAIESLQMISKFNGDEMSLSLGDVRDEAATAAGGAGAAPTAGDASQTLFDAGHVDGGGGEARRDSTSRRESPDGVQDYHSTSLSPQGTGLEGHVYSPMIPDQPAPKVLSLSGQLPTPILRNSSSMTNLTHTHPSHIRTSTTSTLPSSSTSTHLPSTPSEHKQRRPRLARGRSSRPVSAVLEKQSTFRKLPRSIRKPMLAWLDRVAVVLTPPWLRTTLIVWAMWCSMSLAFTMFNVYFPKLVELAQGAGGPGAADEAVNLKTPKSLEDNLWDVVIFALGGCPGALIGAWMVNSTLGRRWSLAGSTFVTAFFCAVFLWAESSLAIRASAAGINLSSTTMWAVLYGWTPEIFSTEVRGTACGIASALSRIGGMIAPILGGILLMINRAFPVWASIVVFIVAGLCTLLLDEGAGKGGKKGGALMAH